MYIFGWLSRQCRYGIQAPRQRHAGNKASVTRSEAEGSLASQSEGTTGASAVVFQRCFGLWMTITKYRLMGLCTVKYVPEFLSTEIQLQGHYE